MKENRNIRKKFEELERKKNERTNETQENRGEMYRKKYR
jgi:hypothetical protein